ncbi:unnamed protein product [Owenia fusiformis]|uniref:Uncharacterized protein n=1 Tax=Owenia fusiformis TaxID=6347 RepID=A0A8J1T5T7_OWEFU|nr:unnamed protein product [Owenia fusiformis]
MNDLKVINRFIYLFVALSCTKASTNKKGSFNNIGYSTKYYHEIGYIYTQSPIQTSVLPMAAYDMEIAAVQCLSTCQKEASSKDDSRCVAANFNTKNGTCQLFSKQPLYRYDKNVIRDKQWMLYMEKALKYPRDCKDITIDFKNPFYRSFDVQPDQHKPPFTVRCGNGNKRPTYIQIRQKGNSLNFQNLTWAQYRNGFRGKSSGQSYYWIGNENLYTLTNSRNYSVRFHCHHGNWSHIRYSRFSVASKENFYRLNVGIVTKDEDNMTDAISGTANEEQNINGSPFLTRENVTENACARQGGWWYKNCTNANFNTANEEMFWGSLRCKSTTIRVYRVNA